MDIKFEKTKTAILAYCIEDWTSLFFVPSFVEQYYRYEYSELIKITSLAIIKILLEEKLIIAGDLTNDNKFIPWEMPLDDILKKIKKDWDNLKRELYMYELVWFDITEKGKKELDSLKNVPELHEPIYYFRICEGGQKGAEELLNKLAKDAHLIKTDTLRKIKVYKLLDNTQFCYREHSKFGMRINTIDIQFSDRKKYIQFKFTEKL